MKPLITVIVVLFLVNNNAFTQQRIAVVDLDATVEQWNRAVRLDDILNQKKAVFQILLNDWLDKLQGKYDVFDNVVSTAASQNTLAEELWKDQDEILGFERIIIDTIPAYRKQVLRLIQKKIQETIDAVAVANGYDLVIAKDNILFYQGDKPIDELIVISTDFELQPIKDKVQELDKTLAGKVAHFSNRIEQY